MKQHYGFVYLTENLINNKKYIGQTTKDQSVEYLGSGKYLLRAIEKYGKENFKRSILAFADTKEELNELERQEIQKRNAVLSEEYYNFAGGGQGGNLGIEVNKKISESISGSKNGMYGKTHTEEVKLKMSLARQKEKHWSYGKEKTEEEKKAISEKLKEFFANNPEAREHLSMKAKTQMLKMTEEELKEANQKRSESLKDFWETVDGAIVKKRHSERFSGKNNPMYGVPPKNKGGKWMNNGETSSIFLDVEEKLKQGWTIGRLKK